MKTAKNWMLGAVLTATGILTTGAKANTSVEYFTVGTFYTSTGPAAVTPASGTYTVGFGGSATAVTFSGDGTSTVNVIGAGTTTLTFAPIPFSSTVSLAGGPPFDILPGVPLGTFTLSSTVVPFNSQNAGGIIFNLDIFQVVPAGSTTFVGTITTSVTLGFVEGATINFTPIIKTAASSPPITYTLTSPNPLVLLGATPGPQTATVFATLSAPTEPLGGGGPPAPLPSVASMGMTMLGLALCGLAGRKLVRRASVA